MGKSESRIREEDWGGGWGSRREKSEKEEAEDRRSRAPRANYKEEIINTAALEVERLKLRGLHRSRNARVLNSLNQMGGAKNRDTKQHELFMKRLSNPQCTKQHGSLLKIMFFFTKLHNERRRLPGEQITNVSKALLC